MNIGNLTILSTSQTIEIVSLVVTIICLLSFCAVFTILFRNYYKHNIADIKDGKDDIELIDNALYIEQQSKNKVKKTFKIIGKVTSWVLFGVVVVGFGFSLASRFSNNNMMLGDSSYIVIATGSMEKRNEANTYLDEFHLTNQINTYDMVEIKKVNQPSDIALYDVIAFKDKDNRTVVHRVIEIVDESHYITRGDSNNLSDPDNIYGANLPFDKVVGKYSGNRVPIIGLFVIFLQSNAGIITIISILYCMLMFDHYRVKCDKAIDERTNLLIDTINYDMQHKEADDVYSHFRQSILYKGETYIFEDGKFVSKDKTVDDGTKTYNDDDMVIIKGEGENATVEVRNIKKDTNLNTDK